MGLTNAQRQCHFWESLWANPRRHGVYLEGETDVAEEGKGREDHIHWPTDGQWKEETEKSITK